MLKVYTGITSSRTIKHSDIEGCRFYIMVPEHYREGGSCKCSNAEHRTMMIREWMYSKKDFRGIPIID